MVAFTGERPGRGPGYEYDESRHAVAYREVAAIVAGRTVVDAGSGDGMGSRVLAQTAARVIGLDHHAPTVEQATRVHGGDNVGFQVADLSRPWPVEGADVVVAFQVLEHFEDDDAFVRHALQAVHPGGSLVLTTPNRLQSFSENPYHVREYTPAELRVLLERHADPVEVLGVFGNERVAAFDARRRAEVERWLRLDPLRIRERLPRPVVEAAFARLSTLVRRRALGLDTGPDDHVTVEDFEVRGGDDLDTCLDLFAVATRPEPERPEA